MATAEEEREIQEKLQTTEQTPNPGDVQRTEEVVASEENDNFDTGETLVFPFEDQGDYPAQVVFTVLKDQPVDLGGIFGNLSALVSRQEKFDERGKKTSDNPKEIAKEEEEKNKAKEENAGDLSESNTTSFTLDRHERGQIIKLFLPQAITINDDVAYTGANLGAMGAVAAGGLAAGGSAAGSAGAGLAQGLSSFVDSLKGPAANPAAKLAIVRTVGGAGELGNAVKSVGKVTLNPNTRQLFESVTPRNFNFSFKFIPMSAKESEIVKQIIKVFRTELYPEKISPQGGNDQNTGLSLGYKFPNKFEIEFLYNGKTLEAPTKILPCFLKSCQITYNPTSMGMHADGNFQEIEMTMNFIEARTLSKEDIKKGY
jgi:type IV secretory pathway VirB2 component (pilin)